MARLRNLLITAGPTREMLDPVRFISNVSTGEMGYALANAAKKKYKVTLISGPTNLTPPKGVVFIPILSALEMKKACEHVFSKQDALIMTAAVADFTARNKSKQKIRRTKTKQILLKQTPDILAGLSRKRRNQKIVGFCLETQNWLENAAVKLKSKNLDGIVANYYSRDHIPFGNRRINTAFINKKQNVLRLRLKSKPEIARALLKWLETL